MNNRVAELESHRLPETAFTALAAGRGDPAVIRLLQGAQQSKHTMLLHAIAEAAGDGDPADRGAAAFRAGYELLTRIQAADPGANAWLLGPAAPGRMGTWRADTPGPESKPLTVWSQKWMHGGASPLRPTRYEP